MKSKTLIGLAVASTFGWSAAAFAGAGHEVLTPYSPNESGDPMLTHEKLFGTAQPGSIGATSSHHASTTVSGSYSSSRSSSSSEQMASYPSSSNEAVALGMDESLAAADEGVYSDYYLVTWTPIAAESWDYYVIDFSGSDQLVLIEEFDVWMPTRELALIEESDQLATSDSDAGMPTHELALIESDDGTTYELALIPTSYDDMFAELPSSDFSDEAVGE
jgi:hypothetical protein